jgi:hypothetical protein
VWHPGQGHGLTSNLALFGLPNIICVPREAEELTMELRSSGRGRRGMELRPAGRGRRGMELRPAGRGRRGMELLPAGRGRRGMELGTTGRGQRGSPDCSLLANLDLATPPIKKDANKMKRFTIDIELYKVGNGHFFYKLSKTPTHLKLPLKVRNRIQFYVVQVRCIPETPLGIFHSHLSYYNSHN